MQRTSSPDPRQQPAQKASVRPSAPMLIDPRDFKQVAGGSPKGGWSATSTSTPTSTL
jgi:hypothetical protein